MVAGNDLPVVPVGDTTFSAEQSKVFMKAIEPELVAMGIRNERLHAGSSPMFSGVPEITDGQVSPSQVSSLCMTALS
jgi:hypothetical protein